MTTSERGVNDIAAPRGSVGAREAFALLTGAYDNIGDAVLRRRALSWARRFGPVHAYVSQATDGWIEELQFVDGDCEVDAGWLDTAHDYLNAHPDAAAAFGRRRERHPDRSIFNRLCDMEWNVAPGDVRSCGGDVMMRSDAWLRAGGYRDDLIAGEEPELCIRLRGAGWRIRCLDAPMTLHDAAITRWGQWWRRTVRTGCCVPPHFRAV